MNQPTSIENKILSHLPELKTYCRFLYKFHNEKAKDLIQTVMMKAFSHLPENDQYIKSWLFRIAYNQFINEVKQDRFKKVELSDDTLVSYQENRFDVQIINDELKQRKELSMYMAGFKYEEIAEMGSVNINTVKSRIRNARIKIAELTN